MTENPTIKEEEFRTECLGTMAKCVCLNCIFSSSKVYDMIINSLVVLVGVPIKLDVLEYRFRQGLLLLLNYFCGKVFTIFSTKAKLNNQLKSWQQLVHTDKMSTLISRCQCQCKSIMCSDSR